MRQTRGVPGLVLHPAPTSGSGAAVVLGFSSRDCEQNQKSDTKNYLRVG